MDKNQSLGLLLLFGLLLGWYYVTAPTAEQLEEQKRIQDSIALTKNVGKQELPVEAEKKIFTPGTASANIVTANTSQVSDTIAEQTQPQTVTEEFYTINNDKSTIKFSNRGGKIVEILLHDYNKITEDKDHNEIKLPLKLNHNPQNKFEYLLPLAGQGNVSTEQILFTPKQSGNTITFTGDLGNGSSITQTYTIKDGYEIEYQLETSNLSKVVNAGVNSIQFNWDQYLDRLEKNVTFEKYYTTVYFKPSDEDSDYCNCRSDSEEIVEDENIKWISHTNQFFNTSIIANRNLFKNGAFETEMQPDDSEWLKLTKSSTNIPLTSGDISESYTIYAGPNTFETLQAYGIGLEEIIPFGRSIFGAINRWIIRPSFNFLTKYIGSKGVVIIVLIFIIKMLLYPLTYKMLQSQARMGALKPKLAHLTEKFKDDPQKKQVETMSIYREYGVSPLGGCMPMVLQMPIWYALFRFFPASITFRQEPFLWATDLSSYDVIANLPFVIPAFGSHISLFTVLWAVTTVMYTYYNTKHMDMSANPAMKYVQYFMPLMFLVFFNNYASGLTCYMFFSNLFNIMQTVVTKKFVFDDDKILAELEEKKKNTVNKPKTGFQARLEEAMKQSQEVQKKRQQQQGAKKKKR